MNDCTCRLDVSASQPHIFSPFSVMQEVSHTNGHTLFSSGCVRHAHFQCAALECSCGFVVSVIFLSFSVAVMVFVLFVMSQGAVLFLLQGGIKCSEVTIVSLTPQGIRPSQPPPPHQHSQPHVVFIDQINGCQ